MANETPPAKTPLTWAETKSILMRWEKLRLIYNGVMLILLVGAFLNVVPLEGHSWWVWLSFLGLSLLGGLLANVCYFAGPLTEIYLAWLSIRSLWSTVILMAVGIITTCVLACLWFMSIGVGMFMLAR